MNLILAEVFFALGFLMYVTTMLQKERKFYLVSLIVCDIFMGSYYLFLGQMTPMALNYIESLLVVCLLIFLIKKLPQKWVTISAGIVWVIYIAVAVLTWTGPLQLFCVFTSSAFLLGLVVKNLIFTKALDVCAAVSNTIYWFCVATVFNGLVGVGMSISVVIGFFVTLFYERKKIELKQNHAKLVEQKTVKKVELKKEKTA